MIRLAAAVALAAAVLSGGPAHAQESATYSLNGHTIELRTEGPGAMGTVFVSVDGRVVEQFEGPSFVSIGSARRFALPDEEVLVIAGHGGSICPEINWLLSVTAGGGAMVHRLPGCLPPDISVGPQGGLVFVFPPGNDGVQHEMRYRDGQVAEVEQVTGASQVVEAQRLLARLGYDPGPADGVMGARTRQAMAAYERDFGRSPVFGLTGWTHYLTTLREDVAHAGR